MSKIFKNLMVALIVVVSIISFPKIHTKIYNYFQNIKISNFKENKTFSASPRVFAAPVRQKVEQNVYDELKSKEEVKVIVILKDKIETAVKNNDKKESSKIRKKRIIKENQKKALLSLSKANFKLKNRYKTVNGFSGLIKKSGIKKLEENPLVKRVYLDRKVSASLSESAPLINANQVWKDGYDGEGQTICVIDSGIDYTHPDIGDSNCKVTNVTGDKESYLLESRHPYKNNYNYTWTITKSGFSNIAVHFDYIKLEKGYDFLYVEDSSGNILQEFGRYIGIYNDVWSVSVPGDTVKIHLVTDYSIRKDGFIVDQVLNGIVSRWANCGQIVGGLDFINEDNDPMDDNGHGTHVSGIIASQNSLYKGIAPGAKIVSAKVLDLNGIGWFSDVAAAIEWCADKKDAYGISIINMSLGDGNEYNNPEIQCDGYLTAEAVTSAKNLGIITFAASGNKAYKDGISYPACASDVISVGGVYDANIGSAVWGKPAVCEDETTAPDKIVCHTNRDEILDLLAPGALITSTISGGGFDSYGGTSMASPHAAAAAAILLEKSPSLTKEQLNSILKNTGVNIYDEKTYLTFHRINIKAALDSISPTVSISVTTDGNVEFGTAALEETIDSSSDIQTIMVDSGPADLEVKSTIFSSATDNWMLGDTNNEDQVIWEYSENGVNWKKFLTNDVLYTLDENVPESESRNLILRITMPTSTSSFDQYSSTVTIVATSPE